MAIPLKVVKASLDMVDLVLFIQLSYMTVDEWCAIIEENALGM